MKALERLENSLNQKKYRFIKRLAIIPARGGSKRLPRKNLLSLGGKPLIAHTINAVINSGCFDKIIFSSDDDEMLNYASKYNQLVPVTRCSTLAGDTVKVIDLVRKIATEHEKQYFDQIGLFLPTCPFRSAKDIAEGIQLLTKDDFSVVSVNEMNDPLQLSLSVDLESNIANPEADHISIAIDNRRDAISGFHKLLQSKRRILYSLDEKISR